MAKHMSQQRLFPCPKNMVSIQWGWQNFKCKSKVDTMLKFKQNICFNIRFILHRKKFNLKAYLDNDISHKLIVT